MWTKTRHGPTHPRVKGPQLVAGGGRNGDRQAGVVRDDAWDAGIARQARRRRPALVLCNPSSLSAAARRASSMAHHLPSTRRPSCMRNGDHTRRPRRLHLVSTIHLPEPMRSRDSPATLPRRQLLFTTSPSICRPCPELSPHAIATLPFLPRPVDRRSTKLSLAILAALPRYQTLRDSCAQLRHILAYTSHLSCKLTFAWTSLPSIVSRPASNIADP
jgi:hypothetical protein